MTRPFDAWWLPTAPGDPADLSLETLQAGSLPCRYPAPSVALVARAIRGLREAGPALRERPVRDIISAVDAVAHRFLDRQDPVRVEAESAVAAATGYSAPMTRLILDRMAADWRADPLQRLLEAELGDPAALDGFVRRRDGLRSRAYGPDLAFHVFAGNVPGVAVTSLIRSLLTKAPVLGKLPSRQPVLPVLFARALADADPRLAHALALTFWPGGHTEPEAPALEAADTVVVYGGDEAVASLRARTRPHARLLVHGPRYSVALIGDDAAAHPDTARHAARAVATFDQHGCVSPHAIWVEDDRTGRALRFATDLATALEGLRDELPRGDIAPAESSAIQQARGAAELKGHAGSRARVFAGEGTSWTVIYDPDPAFRPSCLNRFVRVHPVPTLDEAVEKLRPSSAWLQSAAIEAPEPDRTRLAHLLASIGATRITTLERLPWPEPDWHHDGRGPLQEMLRWVDVES